MTDQNSAFTYTSSQRGIALISALLLLMLMSALAVAVLYSVNTEQRLQKTDSGNNLARRKLRFLLTSKLQGANPLEENIGPDKEEQETGYLLHDGAELSPFGL